MNFLLNRALIKRALILPVAILIAGNFFYTYAFAADSSPFDETVRILERWTASHWGQDCFVWIVHYPEELTDSWVEAEAVRSGMNDLERENFRKNFVSELKLEESETFLVSLYSFGMRPINISPVSENLALISASGEKIKPVKYDSALDYPAGGVVQGLVFFPKQTNKDYAIALKGMSANERIFSFAPVATPAPVVGKDNKENKKDVVVVNLPKRQPKKKVEPEPEITPPPPPNIPQKPIKPLFAEDNTSSDMEDFVKSVKNRDEISKNTTPKTANIKNSRPVNIDNAYSSRETVLRKFLSLWVDLNSVEMYDMLSEQSKKNISRENFAKSIAKASDFRANLKKGNFNIDWVGEERAKVVVTQRALFIKSLITKTLGVTREGSSWKIVWD